MGADPNCTHCGGTGTDPRTVGRLYEPPSQCSACADWCWRCERSPCDCSGHVHRDEDGGWAWTIRVGGEEVDGEDGLSSEDEARAALHYRLELGREP